MINNTSNASDVIAAVHNGLGIAGSFSINNVNSNNNVIQAATIGDQSTGLNVFHSGTGGFGQRIRLNNASSFGVGLDITHDGSAPTGIFSRISSPAANGWNIFAVHEGIGGGAAQFLSNNTNYGGFTVVASNNGFGGSMFLINTNVNNTQPALQISQISARGSLLRLDNTASLSGVNPMVYLSNQAASNPNNILWLHHWQNDNAALRIQTDNNSSNSSAIYSEGRPDNGQVIYGQHFGMVSLGNELSTSAITGEALLGASGVRGVAYGSRSAGIYGYNVTAGGFAGYFDGDVFIAGDLYHLGTKFGQALVKNQNGIAKGIASEEATEEWVSDYGTGQLQNGSVTITIDQEYLSIVNTQSEYHVFIQPLGDSKGLYISQRNQTSFSVTESQNGNSSIAFSYRITAKRKGFENLRMPSVEEMHAASVTNFNSQWPELVSKRQGVHNALETFKNYHSNVQPLAPENSPTISTPAVQYPSTSLPEVTPLQGTSGIIVEEGEEE